MDLKSGFLYTRNMFSGYIKRSVRMLTAVCREMSQVLECGKVHFLLYWGSFNACVLLSGKRTEEDMV